MTLDPRTPVLVGVGQSLRRPSGSVEGMTSPAEMMAEVLRLAAEDSGAGNVLLERADSVQVVNLVSWRAPDIAALVADLVGASPRETVYTPVGGNTPQMLVNDVCRRIQRGESDVTLIAGAEAMYTRFLARRTGEDINWDKGPKDRTPTRTEGVEKPPSNTAEMAASVAMPTQVYPFFECAVRAAAGRGVEEHSLRIGELWSRFSSVAAKNPYAWSPVERSAAEIATATPDNRMVAFPYTKYLCANLQTDQAAALILCSVEAARSAGVPEDRWVFPWSGADAHDHWFVSERDRLDRSPALAAVGSAALGRAGVGIEDVAHLDIYSCFPSAVQVAGTELGFDPWDESRVPTLTGGLASAGGPGNNYVTHSIATMAQRLREDPGSVGMVTGVGWYLTKHTVGVYSTTPHEEGFRWASCQSDVDALPRRYAAEDYAGPAVVDAYTAMYDREGAPFNGMACFLTPDGRRAWSSTTDADLLAAMVTEDLVGRAATLKDKTFTIT